MYIPMEYLQSTTLFFVILLVPFLRKAFFLTHNEVPVRPDRSGAVRYPFFDTARGIAIIAVILIHAVYLFEEKFPDFDRFGIDSLNNVARFAVGFFFISSGALLTGGLSKKKIIRVFIPYVVACLIVGAFQRKSVDLVIGGIARGDLLPPYYFIPVLFQFYLLFPLLKKFSRNNYFLPISILVSYLFYLTPSLWNFYGIPTFGSYLFLFCFGIAYSERLKSKKTFAISHWSLIILIYIVLQFILPAHYYNSRFFYAPAMFVLVHFVWHKVKSVRDLKVLQSFGKASLWIYLIHFSIESFFVNLIPYSFNYSIYLYIMLITILTVVESGVVARVTTTPRKFM